MRDEIYMKRCLQLAENARGNTSPNPLVGSVIVHNDIIIGEGWHARAGEAHAEVNAINSVKNKELLSQSTIYVSLEPCAHFGKTPPCADLIVKHAIPRVVIGCRDPFTAVNGKGIERLEAAGIDVTLGILEEECLQLNEAFFTFHTKQRPFIVLKWAQSQDGYMDKERTDNSTGVNWITQPETKLLVHRWRHEIDAILVGANTIHNDNPDLTVRKIEGKNPVRLIIDPNDTVDSSAKVFKNKGTTIVFSKSSKADAPNIKYIKLNDETTALKTVLKACIDLQIQSVLVEGGAHTLQSFITAGIWDKAFVLTGVNDFGTGLKAPELSITPSEVHYFGKDLLKVYRK